MLVEFAARVAAQGRILTQVIPAPWLPFVIFTLRASDLTLSTVRMLSVIRGGRWLAWLTGFGQALLFVAAVGGVLSHLDNLWNLVAYAAGFATGNVVGMTLEGRFGLGHTLLQVLSPARAEAIADALRREGFGVTALAAHGPGKTMGMLLCNVRNRDLERARRLVLAADPQAMITAENVRALRGGWRA
ncbi:MAG: DUF5698 domain-containing protein [Chloroflexota bacterium]